MAKKNNQIIWAIGILLVFIVVYSYQGNREAQPITYQEVANHIGTGREAVLTLANNQCSDHAVQSGVIDSQNSEVTITCQNTQCHLILATPDYKGTLTLDQIYSIQLASLQAKPLIRQIPYAGVTENKIEMDKGDTFIIKYSTLKQVIPYGLYSCEPNAATCGDWQTLSCGPTTVDGITCKEGEIMSKDNCQTVCNPAPAQCAKSCSESSECLQYEKCSSGKCTLYWCPEGSYRNVNHGCSEYPKPQICCQKQDGSNQVYRATACYTFSTWGGLGSGSDTQVDDTLCAASLTGIPSIAKNEVSTSTTKVLINSLCEFNGNVRGSCADEGQCASIYALKKDGYIDQAETDSILRTIANAWEKENTEADSSVLKWMAWNALKVTPGIGAIPAAYDSYQAIKDVKAWWDGTSLQPEDKERAVAICVSEAPKFDLMQWIKTNIGLEGNAAYIALGVLGVIVLVVLGSLLSPPKPRPTTQI